MKALQFTLPVTYDKSVIVQEEQLPHFYPYLHRHNETQLTWIQEGEGTLVAGTSMHTFSSGDVFLLGANQPHLFKSNPEYFSNESGKQVRSMTVFFNPNGNLSSLFELPEMQVLGAFIQQHSGGFKLPSKYVKSVSQKIVEMQESQGFNRFMLFFQLLKDLYAINGKLEPLSMVPVDHVSESEGIRISTIYNYIMKRYDTMISLEDVAAEAHMTPQAFCRYFKKHTGHTFVTFLNEMRINEACKKLTTGGAESISTVAYSSGFNSITNFNRVFKSVIGNSPREYLENYRSNF
ncbi:AraC family transcriptional regulator [Mucilaginibacter terrae]|uniref:AraC-like DNA-binding protein n=1 Tax=Mucilaginibacter terrae TaxID=1955052 RepID=A0ABU3GV95_9SPHI|nr:AraC family transcriptional regulator [Mucilaginibacter terrae]MDT3403688.1 AraC-like DNA-binding protein [Mucilaginibacter terrae]